MPRTLWFHMQHLILQWPEINTNNCTCVLLKVPIGVRPQIQLFHFLSPKNMHIYRCRTYCTSAYTFIILTVMAGWHQDFIRFSCEFSADPTVPQSSSAYRWISPSCRLSVAGNQTLLHGCSFQAKFQVGCIFISVLWQTRYKCARVLTPPPRWIMWQGDMKPRESNETRIETVLFHYRPPCRLV